VNNGVGVQGAYVFIRADVRISFFKKRGIIFHFLF